MEELGSWVVKKVKRKIETVKKKVCVFFLPRRIDMSPVDGGGYKRRLWWWPITTGGDVELEMMADCKS